MASKSGITKSLHSSPSFLSTLSTKSSANKLSEKVLTAKEGIEFELLIRIRLEEAAAKILCVRVVRASFEPYAHIQSMTDFEFRRMYRVPKLQFVSLVELLRPTVQREQRQNGVFDPAVSVEVMLFITLRILAGANHLDIGWLYGVSSETVYEVFEDTLIALDMCLPAIKFPQTTQECDRNSKMFRSLRKAPLRGVIAALDGLAIEICKPRVTDDPDASKYLNREGFFSIVVQAAVQADYRFCFVSARFAGGAHDATAFSATSLYELLTGSALPPWAAVVADKAYTNEHRVLTPYPGKRLSTKKVTFNTYLALCRSVVEQAFGILICRFGIFWSPIRYPVRIVTLIILVACKLHNFIIVNTGHSVFDFIPSHDDNDVRGEPCVHLQDSLHMEQNNMRSRNRHRESSALRDELAKELQRLGYTR